MTEEVVKVKVVKVKNHRYPDTFDDSFAAFKDPKPPEGKMQIIK